MSQISRTPLSRGAFLTVDNMTSSMAAAAQDIEDVGIDSDNLHKAMCPLKVTWNIPYISTKWTKAHNTDTYDDFFCVPFRTTLLNGETSRTFKLVGMSFGFDTRAEGAGIRDEYSGASVGNSAEQGKLDFVENPYDIELVILEHSGEDYFLLNKIFSQTIPASAYVGPNAFNPTYFEINSANLRADTTYLVGVKPSGLEVSSTKTFALVNVLIMLDIQTELVARNQGLQLMPNHNGAKTGRTVSLNIPSDGGVINADTGTAPINSMLNTMEEQYLDEGFQAGYTDYSDVRVDEQMATDAAYSIIMVPLFSNGNYGGIVANDVGNYPYILNASGKDGGLFDSRQFPIIGGSELHGLQHFYSWQTWNSSATVADSPYDAVASSATFSYEVGVNLCSGLRADGFGYQPLVAPLSKVGYVDGSAASTWLSANIGLVATQTVRLSGPGDGIQWTFEVDDFSPTTPIFLGNRSSKTWESTDILGSPSVIEGQEDLIEVMAQYVDSSGGLGLVSNGGALADGEIIAGYMGHWLQLTLLKPLTSTTPIV